MIQHGVCLQTCLVLTKPPNVRGHNHVGYEEGGISVRFCGRLGLIPRNASWTTFMSKLHEGGQ